MFVSGHDCNEVGLTVVGLDVGLAVGLVVGLVVGLAVGLAVGDLVGLAVGLVVGTLAPQSSPAWINTPLHLHAIATLFAPPRKLFDHLYHSIVECTTHPWSSSTLHPPQKYCPAFPRCTLLLCPSGAFSPSVEGGEPTLLCSVSRHGNLVRWSS